MHFGNAPQGQSAPSPFRGVREGRLPGVREAQVTPRENGAWARE